MCDSDMYCRLINIKVIINYYCLVLEVRGPIELLVRCFILDLCEHDEGHLMTQILLNLRPHRPTEWCLHRSQSKISQIQKSSYWSIISQIYWSMNQ